MNTGPQIPDSLSWVRNSPEGQAWLAELPQRLADCADQWSLRLGPPFGYAFASLAVPPSCPTAPGRC